MMTEDTNLLVLTISAFWSSSRWPLATYMSSRRQGSIPLGGRYRQVALYQITYFNVYVCACVCVRLCVPIPPCACLHVCNYILQELSVFMVEFIVCKKNDTLIKDSQPVRCKKKTSQYERPSVSHEIR